MAKKRASKRIVLGVTGSIACYKAAEVARRFIKRGHTVRVVMTDSAQRFVSPLTFSALTGHPVTCSFWSEGEAESIGHIELADWADVIVIAPATADTVSKLAIGSAETPLLAISLASKAPLVIAPAMNVNMLEHPQTQANLRALQERGATIVSPESGALACGWTGNGRLASPGRIIWEVERVMGPRDLVGKRVVVVAGPTREPIDPVRYISNRSSGKMGIALAREAYRRGAEVIVVHGPLSSNFFVPANVRCKQVLTAREMYQEVFKEVFGEVTVDFVVMAAAVADFKPSLCSDEKIKKNEELPSLGLTKNPDILSELAARRGQARTPVLVGFAVETGTESALLEQAQSKLDKKNVDFVVANLAHDAFERDTNRVWIVGRDGARIQVAQASKRSVARRIWGAVRHVPGNSTVERD